MPLLGQLIASLFAAAGGLLVKLLAMRVAARVLAVATMATLGTALLVGFNGFVAPLVASVFSTSFGQLLGLIFPPISGTVLAGLLVLWAACLTYKLHVQVIKITASV